MGASCTTPPEVTASGLVTAIHWLRATTKDDVETVVDRLAGVLNEEIQVRDGGAHGYSDTVVLGPVKVWWNPSRPEMGTCVEIPGEACEELGPEGLLKVWDLADWRASRIDAAVDHCPFTPAMVAEAWKAGDVDTRVKSLDPEGKRKPMAGRENWRRCEWVEMPDGDLFGMGSRASGQYARCYDSRGFTRFELELKKTTAHAAGPVLMEALRMGADTFAPTVLQLVQRFVRFVKRDSAENVTRAELLPWWAEFVQGMGKARLSLGARVVKTVDEVVEWLEVQVIPSLAVVEKALGLDSVRELIKKGRSRWGPRHLETLQLAGVNV